jgi:hypothetical protein
VKFRLFYQGPLRGNGSTSEKQSLRRAFLPQLRSLWQQKPLADFFNEVNPDPTKPTLVKSVGLFNCLPLVQQAIELVAAIDIVLLRPEEPGNIITQGGDIDNRLKTLLDSLQMPKPNQIPRGDAPGKDENPFYCLLEDDNLIIGLSVVTDRLLLPVRDQHDVILLMQVNLEFTHQHFTNIIARPHLGKF